MRQIETDPLKWQMYFSWICFLAYVRYKTIIIFNIYFNPKRKFLGCIFQPVSPWILWLCWCWPLFLPRQGFDAASYLADFTVQMFEKALHYWKLLYVTIQITKLASLQVNIPTVLNYIIIAIT